MSPKSAWLLDPTVTFLNHGSFGACPKPVLEEQRLLRERLEHEPLRFLLDELEPALDRVRAEIARRFAADPEGIAFVPNATTGVATVFSNLALSPGDEVVVTDHGYGACLNVARRSTLARQARLVTANVALPIRDPGEVVEAVLAALGPRTRLVMIDHVTSPTAIVFPVREIVQAVQARGVDVLVDGAHAPGMVPLELDSLGAAYYTANFHKWCCAPKGAGMLHVRRDRREGFHPLVASHGMTSPRTDRSRFLLEFDWTGTQDPTPVLCVPRALAFLDTLSPEGLTGLLARNAELARSAGRAVAERVGARSICPDSMLGSMVALSLGARPGGYDAETLHRRLFERHRIEIPVFAFPDSENLLVRLCAHAYNELADYEKLGAALSELAE